MLGAVELLSIYNLFVNKGNMAPIALLLNIAMLMGVYAYTWLSTVVDYYSEFTGKQRILLFSTPNSSYKITGAKFLYVFLENIALLIVTCSLVALTNYLWFLQSGDNVIGILFTQGRELLQMSEFSVDGMNIVAFLIIAVLSVVFQYIFSIVTACLAITISTTVISGNRMNWLFSILIYWALSFVLKLVMIIPAFISDSMNNIESLKQMYIVFGSIALGYLVFIIGEYIATNVLITRKLDI